MASKLSERINLFSVLIRLVYECGIFFGCFKDVEGISFVQLVWPNVLNFSAGGNGLVNNYVKSK